MASKDTSSLQIIAAVKLLTQKVDYNKINIYLRDYLRKIKLAQKILMRNVVCNECGKKTWKCLLPRMPLFLYPLCPFSILGFNNLNSILWYIFV